jgi:hypothetical protein
MRTTLAFMCGVSLLACGWVFAMYLMLRHPGYEWRAGLMIGLMALAGVTLAGALATEPTLLLRAAGIASGALLGVTGIWAIRTNVDDGFWDVIGLAFLLQAALAVIVFLRAPKAPISSSPAYPSHQAR